MTTFLDVLLPTDGHLAKLQPCLESLATQTLLPDRVIVLIHKHMPKEEMEVLYYLLRKQLPEHLLERIVFVTDTTSDYEPGNWRGYDRNYLVSCATAKFTFMVDHDNVFGPTLIEDMARWYIQLKEELGSDCILSPTIMWRKTTKVQSQGITGFSYLFPSYVYGRMGAEERQHVMMLWANSLFGPTAIFQQFPFDERFKRCYEDIDFTYRLWLAQIPVIVLNKVEINHMETTKTPLQDRFLGDEATAYERSLNRILFVKKHAQRYQKIAYFGCGLWVQTVGFLLFVLWWGGHQRVSLRRAVIQGTRDGLQASA